MALLRELHLISESCMLLDLSAGDLQPSNQSLALRTCLFGLRRSPVQHFLQQDSVSSALYPSISEVLRRGPPYAQVIPPPHGGYWAQGFHPSASHLRAPPETLQASPPGHYEPELHKDEVTTAYRDHFVGKVTICLWRSRQIWKPLSFLRADLF